MLSQTYNLDCLEAMRGMAENAFDLAIVDPPFGINASKMQMGKGKNKQWAKGQDWDSEVPTKEYFEQLFRVAKKQIIFGGNYFDLPKTGGWIYWNKDRQKEVSFADGELAWTNFLTTLKEIKVRYDGFIGADEIRIHITQKPRALYHALLSRFAQFGDRILDTHLGGGSHRIAAYDLGFDFEGYELDKDYFEAQEVRFKRHIAQPKLFEPAQQVADQVTLF